MPSARGLQCVRDAAPKWGIRRDIISRRDAECLCDLSCKTRVAKPVIEAWINQHCHSTRSNGRYRPACRSRRCCPINRPGRIESKTCCRLLSNADQPRNGVALACSEKTSDLQRGIEKQGWIAHTEQMPVQLGGRILGIENRQWLQLGSACMAQAHEKYPCALLLLETASKAEGP